MFAAAAADCFAWANLRPVARAVIFDDWLALAHQTRKWLLPRLSGGPARFAVSRMAARQDARIGPCCEFAVPCR